MLLFYYRFVCDVEHCSILFVDLLDQGGSSICFQCSLNKTMISKVQGLPFLSIIIWLKESQKNVCCIMSIMKKQAEEEEQNYQKDEKYKKPGLCEFLQKGEKCEKGDTCSFSHGYRSEKQCIFWPKGECEKGDACFFSHGRDEAGGTRLLLYPFKFKEDLKLCRFDRLKGCEDRVQCPWVHAPPGECRHWLWGPEECRKAPLTSTRLRMRCTGKHNMNMMELYLKDLEWKKKKSQENEVKARRKRSRSVSGEKRNNNNSVSPQKKGGRRRSRSAPQQSIALEEKQRRLDMGRKPN